MKKQLIFFGVFATISTCLYLIEPSLAFASFEGSLENIQDKLIGSILPTLAIIGLALAGISFATGNPNARNHVIFAIIGCIIGFGAESIVQLIQDLVK